MIADKHRVTSMMLNELYPELAVTVGADSTLAVFNRQVKKIR